MTLLYEHSLFLEHDTGDHPENAQRMSAVVNRLKESGLADRCHKPDWQPVSRERLLRVHTSAYVEMLKDHCAAGGGFLDPDTIASKHSLEAALLAAGAACDATACVMSEEDSTAFCVVRPPGHHALAAKAMGFCLLNHVAIAARVATAEFECNRVLIVDWDVHHGNGTQDIFWEDPQVGYYSIHRAPFYPHTGRADETGAGTGAGSTLNVPIAYGMSRKKYLATFADTLFKFAAHIRPQLIFISAGFDAHRSDPIGSLGLESEDFGDMTRTVIQLANQYCEGKIVSLLEGGYNLSALADCAAVHLTELLV